MSEFCTSCGQAHREGDAFCARCGTPRAAATEGTATPDPWASTPIAGSAPGPIGFPPPANEPAFPTPADVPVASADVPVASAAMPVASAAVPSAAMQPVQAKPARSKIIRILVGSIPLAILPIILVFGLGDCGSAEGEMAVTASPHGQWTFVPTGCASMQPYGLMGANLHGDGPNDGAVYVTLDHTHGHKVELEVPGSCQNADGTECIVFEVPRDQCQTFEASLDYTGTTVNDVRLVEGFVRLECTLPDGSQIRGSIDFDGC